MFLQMVHNKPNQAAPAQRQKRDQGYTLIELLVVIAIIGLLAGLLMVNFSSIRVISRDRRRVIDIATVHLAIEAYLADGNRFITQGDDQCDGNFVEFLVPNYLDRAPEDPRGLPCQAYGSFTPYYYYAGFRSQGSAFIDGCPVPYYLLYTHLETDGIEQARNDDTCNSVSDPTGAHFHENDNRAYVIVGRGR